MQKTNRFDRNCVKNEVIKTMTRGQLAQKFWDRFTDEQRREIQQRAEKRIAEYR